MQLFYTQLAAVAEWGRGGEAAKDNRRGTKSIHKCYWIRQTSTSNHVLKLVWNEFVVRLLTLPAWRRGLVIELELTLQLTHSLMRNNLRHSTCLHATVIVVCCHAFCQYSIGSHSPRERAGESTIGVQTSVVWKNWELRNESWIVGFPKIDSYSIAGGDKHWVLVEAAGHSHGHAFAQRIVLG